MKIQRKNVVGAAIAAAVLGLSQIGSAAMIVDLRFADASGVDLAGTAAKTQTATAGTDYNVNVWAQVTGADANNGNDGFEFLIGSIQSAQIGGGALTGAAGVGVTTTFQVYNSSTTSGFTATSPTGGPGALDSATADNIQDLGLGTTTSTASEIKVVANLGTPGGTPVLLGTSGATANALPGSGNANTGAEFLLGHVTFHVGALTGTAGAATAVNWVSFQSATAAKTAKQVVDGATVTTLNAGSTVASNASTPNNGLFFLGVGGPPPTLDTVALASTPNGGTQVSEGNGVFDNHFPSGPGAPPTPIAVGTAGTGAAVGSLHIVDLASTGDVYVLTHLTGGKTLADLHNLPSGFTAVDLTNSSFLNNPSNSDWKNLMNLYGNFANVGFKFTAAPGGTANDYFVWDLGADNAAIDQIVAVPEPASLGLVGIGVFALMTRRRRSVK